MFKEISSAIIEIKDKIQSTFIFSNKCKKFAQIFDSINTIFTQSKIKNSNLAIFKEYISKLHDTIHNLNDENWCISFLRGNMLISDFISQFDKSINDIFNFMEVNCNICFTIPSYDVFEDIKQIQTIISDHKYKSEQFRNRQYEINEYHSNIKKSFTNVLDLYDKERRFIINSSSYIKTNKLFENELFECYQGKMKEKDVKITVLKDKEKFYSLFPILSSLEHTYLEQFVGASFNEDSIEFISILRGKPLAEVIQQNKNISLSIVAFKVAEAMSYLPQSVEVLISSILSMMMMFWIRGIHLMKCQMTNNCVYLL